MLSTRIATAAVCLAAVGMMAGCGSGDSDSSKTSPGESTSASTRKGEKVTLAYIGDTLTNTDLHEQMTAGVNAATAYINDDLGGFGGRPLEIFACDPKSDPGASSVCARRALAEKPVAMIGLTFNWGTTGLPLFSKAGILSFNGPNSPVEQTDPWSVGIANGGPGEYAGSAAYLCQQQAKKVAILQFDVPFALQVTPNLTDNLEACGVEYKLILINPSSPDIAPAIAQAVEYDGDYVFTAATSPSAIKALGQAGVPGDKIIGGGDSAARESVLEPAGPAAEGMILSVEWANWSDTSNPDVKLYHEQMEKYAPDVDADNQFTEWGFGLVMSQYLWAEEIGFDEYNKDSLVEYFKDTASKRVFLGHDTVQPGFSTKYPRILQPHIQMVQWKDGKMTNLVTDDGGWVTGLGDE